jgi:redox-sensitive bicupin YhaK (pirin superfamily)
MPAVTVENALVLPRIARPRADEPETTTYRAVDRVVPSVTTHEGAGFLVHRPFPGSLSMQDTDPFLLLDQMGPVVYGPREAKGAPWHPHRGFETVTYLLDGEMEHHDSNGGGGLIAEGDTQWMTAGAGILHDELPSQKTFLAGGRFHGVQLWVNLPAAQKWVPPRYQGIVGSDLVLLTSDDGGALVRLIAGSIDGNEGPGNTYTPITYAHATVAPGARLAVPWNPAYNALVYVLGGQGYAGLEDRPIADHELAVFGAGDALTVRAADHQDRDATALDVLLLGGAPLREPIAHYGPFVMNTKDEIMQAMRDFEAGRLGTVPAVDLADERRR